MESKPDLTPTQALRLELEMLFKDMQSRVLLESINIQQAELLGQMPSAVRAYERHAALYPYAQRLEAMLTVYSLEADNGTHQAG